MSNDNTERVNFWKQKADEIRVQLNLGAAEASQRYQEEKKEVSQWVHNMEQKLRENSDATTEKLKIKLEELKLQAALGKAEAEDEFREQRKKFNQSLHDAKREAEKLSKDANEKAKELGEEASGYLSAWQTQFELFQVQMNLAAKDARDKWGEEKVKFQSWLDGVDNQLEDLREDGKETWDTMKEEFSQGWASLKSRLTKS